MRIVISLTLGLLLLIPIVTLTILGFVTAELEWNQNCQKGVKPKLALWLLIESVNNLLLILCPIPLWVAYKVRNVFREFLLPLIPMFCFTGFYLVAWYAAGFFVVFDSHACLDQLLGISSLIILILKILLFPSAAICWIYGLFMWYQRRYPLEPLQHETPVPEA